MGTGLHRDLDAGTLVGALADDDRRKVFAAIELGASTTARVAAMSGLDMPAVTTAVGRLAAMGLVVSGDDGTLAVLDAAFARAARRSLQRVRSSEHDDVVPANRAVFEAFVSDGRITAVPARRGKRLVLLDWLAQDFEPGVKFTENQVNAKLGVRHPDTAAWRRYLITEGFLDRHDGIYWRCGGSVGVAAQAAPGRVSLPKSGD